MDKKCFHLQLLGLNQSVTGSGVKSIFDTSIIKLFVSYCNRNRNYFYCNKSKRKPGGLLAAWDSLKWNYASAPSSVNVIVFQPSAEVAVPLILSPFTLRLPL